MNGVDKVIEKNLVRQMDWLSVFFTNYWQKAALNELYKLQSGAQIFLSAI